MERRRKWNNINIEQRLRAPTCSSRNKYTFSFSGSQERLRFFSLFRILFCFDSSTDFDSEQLEQYICQAVTLYMSLENNNSINYCFSLEVTGTSHRQSKYIQMDSFLLRPSE